MNIEFVLYMLCSFVAGAILTSMLISWALRRAINRKMQEIEQLIKNHETEAVNSPINLRVEKHQDTLYCYNSDTNEFVCQGVNFENVFLAFKSRFPNRSGIIVQNSAHFFANDSTAKDHQLIG